PSKKMFEVSSHITLKNNLPKEKISGATLLIRTSEQEVKVYVNGILIYGSEVATEAYHFIRLSDEYSGKEISVVLTSPCRQYASIMNQIHIGSKASNIFSLIKENGIQFIIGFVIFAIGIFAMITVLFSKNKKSQLSFIYLSSFFICAGYWLLMESKLMQFLIPYPVAITNSNIFALTLLPVFSSLYYYTAHVKSYRKVCRAGIEITVTISFIMGMIAFLKPEILLHAFPLYLLLFGAYLIAVFVSVIAETKKNKKVFSFAVWGVLTICISGFIELIFYFLRIKNYDSYPFIAFGMIIFCVFMVMDAVKNIAKVQQEAVKVNALTALAYMDGLTQLKNRTAFLEKMSTIEPSEKNKVTVAMFDINNLKVINDTLGHLVGDAMIRHCAKALKNTIRPNDELYRIGGDEFVVIMFHENELDIKQLKNRFCRTLEKENSEFLSYELSVAYGYATFIEGSDKNIFETLARADEKMYICKKRQKSK
ncbi:MAG: diguanylate cyclase, partial [Oscillospiraceae bacterium]